MLNWKKKEKPEVSGNCKGSGSPLEEDRDSNSKQVTLSDIACGIQYAINTTQHVIGDHYQNIFDTYFTEDYNHHKVPMTTTIKVSDKHILEVPKIAIMNMNNLLLDEMTVNLALKINVSDIRNLKGQDLHRACFSVAFTEEIKEGKSNDIINITMKFKAGNPPEAVEKIIEEMTRKIFPVKLNSGNAEDENESEQVVDSVKSSSENCDEDNLHIK